MRKRNWLKRLLGKLRMKDAMGIKRAKRFSTENLKKYYLDPKFYAGHTDLSLLPAQNSVALGKIALDWIPYSLLGFPRWWRWN
jgi:hypothetical protein